MIEEIWLEETGEDQLFLQGIIQAAVGFHHYQQGKFGAARSMLRMAIEKLEACSVSQFQMIGANFLEELKTWKAALDRSIATGTRESLELAFPKIVLPQGHREGEPPARPYS